VINDGVITVRPPWPDDRPALIALRDDAFRRFIGEGSPDPRPTFCILVDEQVVGWVDADEPGLQDWLAPHERNLGYALHPDHRGKGYATRALMLLLHHLSVVAPEQVATLAIDFDNQASQAIAGRCGFVRAADLPASTLWKKPIPPTTYTDGVVTIRPPTGEDTDRHLAATDEVQIHWLWPEEHRVDWASKTPDEQREHQLRFLERTGAEWGSGPQWWFVIEVGGTYVGHVDANLANPNVPHGEVNISYSCHPDERGKGYVSRAVRLVLRFIAEHTGAREAHIEVDPANEASMRVARSVGAVETERTHMVRHVIPITR
jgi:RimJ/RimL family protein N-acetyltransferase